MSSYKELIETAVVAFPDRFESPSPGPMEYRLVNDCRADFCFRIKPTGFLFVEDDDGARAVNNLIKYWIWAEKNAGNRPCHLIHIVERSRPAQIVNLKFLAQKMEAALQRFRFHLVLIAAWVEPCETWLPEFRNVVESIASSLTCEQAIAADRADRPRSG